MKKTTLFLLLVAACSPQPPADATPHAPAPAPVVAAATPTAADPLAQFDTRTPLPLLAPMAAHQREQMRGHLVAVHDVVAALAHDDLDAAATAGARLGTSDSMMAMCSHMGAGAPGFTERATAFHRTADGISAAARAGDRDGAFRALDETLAQCTSCHETYRQQIVDQAAFDRAVAAASAHR